MCCYVYLVNPLVGCSQAGLDAHRGLICELDAHLQQADGECCVRLCSNPQSEVLMHAICFGQHVLQLQRYNISRLQAFQAKLVCCTEQAGG